MTDFARHALAYVTGRPVEEFKSRRTASLSDELIPLLQKRPWLLVLDGLERVLVAYHRIDKAQVRDEDVEKSGDPTVSGANKDQGRDTRECIRDADTELLQRLTQAGPSKMLMSSRLTPRALLNHSGTERPGVRHEQLTGLDPDDALDILRAADIRGDDARIRNYLRKHFGCHPLVVGVVAGLVRNYRQAPSDFDRWADDPKAGAEPHLADWNVIQKKNHILQIAFEDLTEEQRTLLGRLALIGESCDDATLQALNPHRPDPPEAVSEPSDPDGDNPPNDFELMRHEMQLDRAESDQDKAQVQAKIDQRKAEAREEYHQAKQNYHEYQQALTEWRESESVRLSGQRLDTSRADLEQRGLLHWDRGNNTYDLHPVVRGYALDSSTKDGRAEAGERVADYFSKQIDADSERVTSLQDLSDARKVHEALIKAGHYDRAFENYSHHLEYAVWLNLEQPCMTLELLQPLFADGFENPSRLSSTVDQRSACIALGNAFIDLAEYGRAQNSYINAISLAINIANRYSAKFLSGHAFQVITSNYTVALVRLGRLYLAHLSLNICRRFADFSGDDEVFQSILYQSDECSLKGNFSQSDTFWEDLQQKPRPKSRNMYRPGDAEIIRCKRFLREEQTSEAKAMAQEAIRLGAEGNYRFAVRVGHYLDGEIRIIENDWEDAIQAFQEASRMQRESGMNAADTQARIALAQARSGDTEAAQRTLDNLHGKPDDLNIAEVYVALGDHGKAREHAFEGYKRAWADGPPYAFHWELQRAKAVYAALGDPEPELPAFDPDNFEKLPFEDELLAFIAELNAEAAEREAKKAAKAEADSDGEDEKA